MELSRRRSRRTVIDAHEPQAWFAHWWKDEWAEETLTICEQVYHTQRRTLIHGAYTTTQWKNVDDHFREWLVEKALEFRSKVNIFTVSGDLECSWYRMLHANLTRMSKYHFFHYCREHGIHADETSYAYTTQSTDYLTEELGDAWIGDRYKQNNDILYKDPERVIILLERLLTGPTVDDMTQALKDPALCEWEGCQRHKEKRDWCSKHYAQHRQLWGVADAPRCSEPDCPDYGIRRGRCSSHYNKHRRALIKAGKWQPQTAQGAK